MVAVINNPAQGDKSLRWNESARGPYIRTRNGTKFFLTDPQPADFDDVEDLAHHLTNIYRYTGGSRISVAQHMVVGARMAERYYPHLALLPARFLIHDVSEARYGDMSSPLKSLCPEYKKLEERAELAIETRFDLQFLGVPEVKELDYRMWLTERLIVFPDLNKSDDYAGTLEPFPLSFAELNLELGYWDPEYTESEWMFMLRRHLPWVKW